MIPKDVNEVEALVSQVEDIVARAAELAKSRGPYGFYWDSDDGYSLTREGVVLHEHGIGEQYGDTVLVHEPCTITWLDLLRPETAIARWNKAKEEEALKRKAARLSHDRGSAERGWARDCYCNAEYPGCTDPDCSCSHHAPPTPALTAARLAVAMHETTMGCANHGSDWHSYHIGVARILFAALAATPPTPAPAVHSPEGNEGYCSCGIARWNKAKEEEALKRKAAQDDWERRQYEQLKRKFDPK